MTLNAIAITVLLNPNKIVINSQGLLVTASIISENTVQIVVKTVVMLVKMPEIVVVMPFSSFQLSFDLFPPSDPTKRSTRLKTKPTIKRTMGTPITGLSMHAPRIVGNNPKNHVKTEFAYVVQFVQFTRSPPQKRKRN